MKVSRRHFGVLSAAAVSSRVFGQGVAPRAVKPEAKPAPSGLLDAHFTDVAREAGLTAPVIYGNPDFKDYILEAVGCGCAFIDYDNDGCPEALSSRSLSTVSSRVACLLDGRLCARRATVGSPQTIQ